MEIRFYSSRDGQRFYACYSPTRYMMIEKTNPLPRIRNIWPPIEEDEEPVYEKSMEIEDLEPSRLEDTLQYFIERYLLDILEDWDPEDEKTTTAAAADEAEMSRESDGVREGGSAEEDAAETIVTSRRIAGR